MKFSPSFYAAVIICGSLLLSCKQQEKKDNAKNDPNEASPTQTDLTAGIKGNFYIIQCDSATFVSLRGPFSNGNGDPRGNVVFKYFIQEGKFTLKGWEIKGANSNNFNFDQLPNIAFLPTNDISTITYGDATALGDFLLTKVQVKAIKDALVSRKHNLVVFAPTKLANGTIVWSGGTLNTFPKLTPNNLLRRMEPVNDCDMDPIPPRRYDR